tara:strand:+ start:198 stop:404 length:207 start_codon:yes stop_codon:yes gene_type:complete
MNFILFVGFVVFLVSMSFLLMCSSRRLETENAHQNSHRSLSDFSKHVEQTCDVPEAEDEEPPSYSQVV